MGIFVMPALLKPKKKSSYIAVAHDGSPYFTLLKRSGDSVSLASTYTLPNIGYGCSFWESS